MQIERLLSQSMCKGEQDGAGVGVSLWEAFVTSVTAVLDGWAASIWLQRM